MKTDRLFQIIYILLEKQTVTAPELAEKLEVSVRTIYRDIDSLSASGIPVYARSGKNGGISLMPGYTFDKSLLSDKEQDEILYALQSLQAAGQNVELLLSKLGTVFQKAGRSWIEVDFSRWGYQKEDTAKFNAMKQGILEKRILAIEYCSSSGESSRRRVKPVRLVFKSKNWYMQAYCLKAQDFRTFKISRILSLKLEKEHFEETFDQIQGIEGNGNGKDNPKQAAPMENGIQLKLKVSSRLAFRVYDEFAYEDIQKQEDGSLILNPVWPYDNWVYSYILSFGSDLEILEPEYLKEDLAEYLKNILKHLKPDR